MVTQKFINYIMSLRKQKKLHNFVENHLIKISSKIFPGIIPVKEVQGLAGGRNDLIFFEFNKRKILFEIFATKSQVSRDLRILDKTLADIKIAIIIDKEIDTTVVNQFLKENPENNYSFLFISELFAQKGIFKLAEIIHGDEESKFKRMLSEKISYKSFLEEFKKEGIDILTETDIASKKITLKKAIVTILIKRLQRLGIKQEYLKYVGKFISSEECIRFILLKINFGFNLFLFTDLDGNCGVYSDLELLDWIKIGNELEKPFILLSLNALFHSVIDKYFVPSESFKLNKKISITIGHSEVIETENGRTAIFSIPKNTKAINLLKPLGIYKKGEKSPKKLTKNEIKSMIRII